MPKMLHPVRAAAVSLLMVNAFAAPIYAAPAASPAVETVQTAPKDSLKMQAATLADRTGKTTKKAWKFMNTDRPQTKTTLNMRRKAMRVLSPVNRAMGGAFSFTDNQMSRPFLFLTLAFIMVLGLLGMSSATARTGGHH